MKVENFVYQDQSIRYVYVLTGVLFNTSDVCSVLKIADRPAGTIFGTPCMDIVSVFSAALSEGRNEMDFFEAIQEKFIDCDSQTQNHPICDDNWSSL